MKKSTIILTAALGPVGIMCIASGFLNSCSQIGLTNLEGDAGRSIMLQAYCKVQGAGDHWTELDLNTCFGWSADTCNFISPPAGHFTDSCTSCYTSTGDFDGTFACRGPCNAGGEAFKMFNLNDYVGNLIGDLVC
ncbi:hypothetical protein LA080_002641 [Diaporthe eres]|uniref:Cyanovirin-N domain-containing protein n=1 Tax=Diaporthe vaccinii TaxID=105482 RepID=A0ABR4EIW6_9PEZI|nr:hypothetical protein LA080_002641 [Diaporthe eres]